jgi:hypothetical protein
MNFFLAAAILFHIAQAQNTERIAGSDMPEVRHW